MNRSDGEGTSQSIKSSLVRNMAQVDEDSQPVHLPNEVLAKIAIHSSISMV